MSLLSLRGLVLVTAGVLASGCWGGPTNTETTLDNFHGWIYPSYASDDHTDKFLLGMLGSGSPLYFWLYHEDGTNTHFGGWDDSGDMLVDCDHGFGSMEGPAHHRARWQWHAAYMREAGYALFSCASNHFLVREDGSVDKFEAFSISDAGHQELLVSPDGSAIAEIIHTVVEEGEHKNTWKGVEINMRDPDDFSIIWSFSKDLFVPEELPDVRYPSFTWTPDNILVGADTNEQRVDVAVDINGQEVTESVEPFDCLHNPVTSSSIIKNGQLLTWDYENKAPSFRTLEEGEGYWWTDTKPGYDYEIWYECFSDLW